MMDIPKLEPIPQETLDALADSVAICERIAAEYRKAEELEHESEMPMSISERNSWIRAREENVD